MRCRYDQAARIRVKNPAPPIVALLGLLGMVLGEQLGTWVHTKNVNVSQAASVCLVGESYDRARALPPYGRAVFGRLHRRDLLGY
jgi:xanthosine utilization system XapX-like protein